MEGREPRDAEAVMKVKVEHLRRNMTLLLDKITKELQKSKKLLVEVQESLPKDYKGRNLDEIDTFFDDFKVRSGVAAGPQTG